jgi:hypothetical protein
MDKIISIYWFGVLFITAGVIAYMVIAFYGSPYDARRVEAGLLRDKVAECLSEGGYLKNNIISNEGQLLINSENFLSLCDLNFKTPDFASASGDSGEYYIKVDILGKDDGVVRGSVEAGNLNLKNFCSDEFIEERSKTNPFCFKTEFYSLDSQNKKYILAISALVRKTEKNAH